MDDIKFRCPECTQKIAVVPEATGFQIECPACRSVVIIPKESFGVVKALIRRKVGVVVGSLNDELIAKQADLDSAIAETRQLREKVEEVRVDAELARHESNASRTDRDRALSETQRLREAIALADSEREQLRANGDTTKHHDYLGEITKLKTERDELSAKLTVLVPLRDQLDTVTTERDRLQLQLDAATQAAERAKAEATAARDKQGLVEAQARELASQLSSIGSEIAMLRNHASTTEKLPGELAAARGEISLLQSQVAELDRALETARLDRAHAVKQVAEREQALDLLEGSLESVRQEAQRHREEAAVAAAERERHKASAEEFAEEARELQQRVDGLLDDLHAREREIAELKNSPVPTGEQLRVEELAVRLASKEREAADALAELTQLRNSLSDAQQRAEHAARETAAAEDERARLVEQFTKSATDHGAGQEQLRQLRTEREQARSRAAELELQIEKHLDQIHDAESERDAARTEAEGIKAGLERAKQHVSVLQARRDVMREEINQLRQRLGIPADSVTA